MGDNPAVVGSDSNMELRDGHGQFSFVAVGKPYVKHGDQQLDPSHGFATISMDDGVWRIGFVHLHGSLIGKKGAPVKKEIHFSWSLDHEVGTGDAWHPDYAPPQWLLDFVRAFENRLSGRTEA